MLDERSKNVLFAVIQCYINDPGPVGSRVVTRKFPFGLSPATIRNIMSDLEEMGLLAQPHTSAGRVPTDLGYRYYVDNIRDEKTSVNNELVADINKKLEVTRQDINSVLDEASRMLSSLSHYLGIGVSPNTAASTLSRIELIKHKGNQMAVILFMDEGVIKHKMVTIDPELTQAHLTRISEYINSQFSGQTVEKVRDRVARDLSVDRVRYDDLITQAVRICRDVFSSSPGNVYISGLSEMLQLPDFCDIDKIKELLHAIEDKHLILRFLDQISDSEGTQVFIGSENPLDEMKKLSMVVSTYREGSRPIGAIGIIGPTRMNYPQVITIVASTANYITEMLSHK